MLVNLRGPNSTGRDLRVLPVLVTGWVCSAASAIEQADAPSSRLQLRRLEPLRAYSGSQRFQRHGQAGHAWISVGNSLASATALIEGC